MTSIERLREAEVRPDAASVVRAEEEKLNYVFDELCDGIEEIVSHSRINAELLRSLLAGLALCGGTQIKALIWLDMKEAAERRASRQCSKLQDLAFRMPRQILAGRLEGGAEEASAISQDCSEIRLRLASQPSLVRSLIHQNIHGREFIDRIQTEPKEPLFVLPVS